MKKFQNYIYDKPRIEAFSDGVFAIIITLLILEIKVPEIEPQANFHDTVFAIWTLKAKIISWAISFLMVGVGWLQHHNLLHMTRKVDLAMIWLNLFILMTFCLVPFTTAMMGDNPMNPTLISIFGIELGLAAFCMCLLYWYVYEFQLKETYDKKSVHKHVILSSIFGPLLYTVAALTAFINPYLAYTLFCILPLAFIFPMDKENLNDYDKH